MAAISLAVLALTGCATEARLTVHSQPEGAYITTVRSGQGIGMAPAVIHYDANYLMRHRDANGCYVLDGVEARWPSGAASSIEPVVVCNNYSENYDITLSRPADYPDLDKDASIALQLRETRAHEREAAAAMATAAAIQRDAIATEQYSYELARQRAELERIRREEWERDRERHDRDRRDHDGHYDRREGDHRDGGRDNQGSTGMKPPTQIAVPPPATALTPTIHAPPVAPPPATSPTPTIHAPAATPPPPAKAAEPAPYDPKDPHRPKGSKGYKGDE